MEETITIAETILQRLDDRSAYFVFPSAVPASFWAQRAAETTGKPVALERFIAWDDFKARVYHSTYPTRFRRIKFPEPSF